MLIQLYIVGIATLINTFFGMFIYLRNPRSKANQAFLILTATVVVWMLSSYLGDNGLNYEIKLFFIQLSYAAGLCIIGAVIHLANSLPSSQKYTPWDKIVMSLLAATAASCFTRIIVGDIKQTADGLSVTLPGSLYALYIIVFLIAAFKAAVAFRRQLHKADITGKKQIYTMAIGINLGLLWGLTTNAILPVTLGVASTSLGPIATVILVLTTGYAIVRHHTFDIRYLLLRFVAYVISVTAIILIFSIFAFFITGLIFGQQEVSLGRSVYYIVTAVLIAIAFEPLRKLINAMTNKLFFRQNYSIHEAISEISGYITRNVDAKQIELHSLKVINRTIRPEYGTFLVFNREGELSQAVCSGSSPTNTLLLKGFLDELGRLRKKLITAEDVKSASHLKHYMDLGHIGLIAKLSTTNKTIGYLILGEKKNGSSYSSHDLQFANLTANDLALALQNALAFEEIQAFNATLQYKINNATKALKRTNEKLIALDDAKDEFIGMASHQLRTPLTSIKGYISMILEGDLGKINTAQRQALKEAFDSSQRMVFLISDFLNVSRIRTGKFALELTETNLTQIVSEEIGQLRDMAGLRGQEIVFTPPANFPLVTLDEMKIRQVMMNMIDNAIFYTPKEGRIEIILEHNKKEVVFKVSDNGIGVPLADQHRLFTKFFRASNARNARPDGTGLGLFMAQKIISAQGGKVIFKSVQGEGSTFGFRFPLSKISLKP